MNRKTSKSYNSSKKVLTLFVVFILLFTAFSTVVSSRKTLSEKLSDFKEKVENIKTKERPILDSIKSSQLKENIKEKVQNILNLIKKPSENNKNRFIKSSPTNNFLNSLANYISLKESSSLLSFYTNYAGNEKTTDLRLGMSKSIDVDDDGDNDIRVSYKIFPGIERPLVLTFNIRLKIDRLIGFEDPNELFEAFLQVNFLGILDVNNTNDKIKFGYASEKGQEAPDAFHITYKYVPYIFYKEKPKHMISFNPGLIADIDNLGLIFGYDNANGEEYSSQSKWTTYLDPVVKTDITFGGADDFVGRQFNIEVSDETKATITYDRIANGSEFNGGLVIDKLTGFSFEMEVTPFKEGGGRIEYMRNGTDPVDVTLFFKKNNSAYIYVDDIPQHVLLSWLPESEGSIEFNTFDDRLSRIGIRDTPPGSQDFKAHAYIENVPSFVNFSWNLNPAQNGELSIFCEQSGSSAHLLTKDLFGTGTSVEAHFYTNEHIDLSVFWDRADNSFGIRRTSTDVQLSLKVVSANGSSFNFSAGIRNTITGPFEIKLGDIFDGDAEIEFTTNIIEIYNLSAELVIPSVGKFVVKLSEMEFDKQQSGIEFRFSGQRDEDSFTLNIEVQVIRGVIIRGLIFGYNDFLFPVTDIIATKNSTYYFNISATNVDVDFWISEDGSKGYVHISGGLIVTFDTIFKRNGIVLGTIQGCVSFDTTDGYLNISWDTVDGQTQLNMEANGVASLSGFKLWVKNKIDINIPSIVGEFTLSTKDKTGEIRLFLDSGSVSLATAFNIKIIDLMNVTLQAGINLYFDLSLSGYVGFAWDNGNITYISGGVGAGYTGTAKIFGLHFAYQAIDGPIKTIDLSADEITFQGDFLVTANITFENMNLSDANFEFKTPNNDLTTYFEIKGFSATGLLNLKNMGSMRGTVSFGRFFVGIGAKISFNLHDMYLYFNGTGQIFLENFRMKGMLDGTKVVAEASIALDATAILIVDLNNSYIDLDIEDETKIEIEVDTNYPMDLDAYFRATIQSGRVIVRLGEDWTELSLSDDEPIIIEDFRVELNNYKNPENPSNSLDFMARFDKFFIVQQNRDATVNFSSNGILFKANIKAIGLNKLVISYVSEMNGELNMSIDGQMSFGLSGPLMIHMNTNPSSRTLLLLNLMDGKVTLTNFNIEVYTESMAANVQLGLDSFIFEGSVGLKVTRQTEGLKVETVGYGYLDLNDLNLDLKLNGETVVSLGSFSLKVYAGASIDIVLSEPIQINSVSASGALALINIQDLYINLAFQNETGSDFLIIEEANIDFKGSGTFNFYLLEYPRCFEISLNVKDSNSKIEIKKLYVDLFIAIVQIEDFIIQGSTTISIEGGGYLDSEFEVRLNADTESWSIGYFRFSMAFEFESTIEVSIEFSGFAGQGQIGLGFTEFVDTNIGGESYGKVPHNLIISVAGSYEWNDLILGVSQIAIGDNLTLYRSFSASLGYGTFDGNADLYVDLALIYDFNLAFRESIWKLNVNGHTIVDIHRMEFYGRNGLCGIIQDWSFDLNEGEFVLRLRVGEDKISVAGFPIPASGYLEIESSGTIEPTLLKDVKIIIYSWDFEFTLHKGTISVPYLNITWDLDRFLAGQIFVDTKTKECYLDLDIINIISLDAGASFRAGGATFTFDLDGDGIGFIEVESTVLEYEGHIGLFNKWEIGGRASDYFRLEWDINFDKSGYVFIDTNNEVCDWLYLEINDRIKISGHVWRAEDRRFEWDDVNPLLNLLINLIFPSGTIEYNDLEAAIYIDGVWYNLLNWDNFGGLTSTIIDYSGDGNAQNMNPGDTFRVQVTDSDTGDPVEGADVYYYGKRPLIGWEEFDHDVTDSDGKTKMFSAQICISSYENNGDDQNPSPLGTGDESNCMILTSHDDYLLDDRIYFNVNGGSDPIADAGGPYISPDCPTTITLNFSGCYDPDGDQLTQMWIDWNWFWGKGYLDGDWYDFTEHPQHNFISMACSPYTICIKVKNVHGEESDYDTATVTIGTDMVVVDGFVYNNSAAYPKLNPIHGAIVQVVGTQTTSQTNVLGYYPGFPLNRGQTFTLRVTADGYETYEQILDTNSVGPNDKLEVDFYLNSVNMAPMDVSVTWDGATLYENEPFDVSVEDQITGYGISGATVLYQYSPSPGIWSDKETKYTNSNGEATFNAVDITWGLDYANCRVIVNKQDYATTTSAEFLVHKVANSNPIADAGGDYNVDLGETVNFDFSGCYDPDGDDITQMNINWGHDLTWTGWMAYNSHPQHTYYVADTYIVKLKVKDTHGAISNIDEATVTVGENIIIVDGYIKDDQNSPISGARVEVLGTQTSAQSNWQGYYWLPLEPGSYTLKANKDGYESQTKSIIIPNDQTGNYPLNFKLNEISNQLYIYSPDEVYEGNDFSVSVYNQDGDNVYASVEFAGNTKHGYTITFTAPSVGSDTSFTIHAWKNIGDYEDAYKSILVKVVCFVAGTKISMANGEYKNIEDVEVGEEVKCYDEINHTVTSSLVTKTFYHGSEQMSGYYLIINDELKVTPDHPIFVNGEWISAREISVGDCLQNIENNEIEVYSIEKIFDKVPTYNLEVETYHNYYAENLLVHNKPR